MQDEPKSPKTDESAPAYQPVPTVCAPAVPEEDDEINLLDLLIVLLKHKKMIFSVVFLAGVLAVVYSLTATNIYRSECTLAPTSQEKGIGGLAALGGLGAMVASEAGITVAGSLEQFSVVLKSRELTNIIVRQHNLMPVLFEKSWDKKNQRWKIKNPPTLQDAYKSIQEILNAAPDKKQNIMKLTFELSDPRLAQTILNYYVEGLSEYLRRQTLDDTEAQQAQLYEQLAKTTDPLLKNKLYDLIARQIEKETLARVQKYYSFSVIDPPFVPERKFKPKRAMICVLSVVAASFIAVFLAFFLEYVQNLKTREDPERLASLRSAIRLRKRS
jgi:uncharacterized protein involved in exopolysaccharide biosynthesis